jgi:hypothetical protein
MRWPLILTCRTWESGSSVWFSYPYVPPVLFPKSCQEHLLLLQEGEGTVTPHSQSKVIFKVSCSKWLGTMNSQPAIRRPKNLLLKSLVPIVGPSCSWKCSCPPLQAKNKTNYFWTWTLSNEPGLWKRLLCWASGLWNGLTNLIWETIYLLKSDFLCTCWKFCFPFKMLTIQFIEKYS